MEIDTMMDMGHMGTMITNSSRTPNTIIYKFLPCRSGGNGFRVERLLRRDGLVAPGMTSTSVRQSWRERVSGRTTPVRDGLVALGMTSTSSSRGPFFMGLSIWEISCDRGFIF